MSKPALCLKTSILFGMVALAASCGGDASSNERAGSTPDVTVVPASEAASIPFPPAVVTQTVVPAGPDVPTVGPTRIVLGPGRTIVDSDDGIGVGWGVSIAPDGQQFVHAQFVRGTGSERSRKHSLVIRDLESGRELRTIPVLGFADATAWSSTGDRIAYCYSQPNRGLAIVELSSGENTDLPDAPACRGLIWSPETELKFYRSSGSYRRLDLETLQEEPIDRSTLDPWIDPKARSTHPEAYVYAGEDHDRGRSVILASKDGPYSRPIKSIVSGEDYLISPDLRYLISRVTALGAAVPAST